MIKKVKNSTYSVDLNGKELVETFYEKEPPKTNQTDFKIKKLFEKKDDKFYIKWKGYDNSFNRCIDKKDIVIFTFQSHVVIVKMK